jgi:zinc protease
MNRRALIPCTKHVLANGLQVLLHEDHSEPVVAVYVYYHVGSSREEPGRSGFAHLFEHMLFQGSAHVPDNDHFRRIQEAGGTLNGTTSQDRTNYFEVLPAKELELALWLESDRMGFLLPAMTQAKLDNQRDVVMNERRQSYENRPYGLVHETLLGALFPSGHPYSWPTIGSMKDIAAATLADIERFFRRWYGPNNATLVLGGDFEPAAALALVERWFGSLARGPAVEKPAPAPAQLAATRRLVLEDRVQQPQLTLAWPTVELGHPDEAALDLLADYLSASRSSVLDRALELEEELVTTVSIAHHVQERAGMLLLNLRPHEGVTLGRIEARVEELLAEVARAGVDGARLARLMRRREGELFRSLETVAARTSRLGYDNVFFRDPAALERELERRRAVRPADVEAVLARHVLARPRVVLSTVPRQKSALAAADRALEQREARSEPARATAPSSGPAAAFRSPAITEFRLPNGLSVLANVHERLPMTRLSLALPAGRVHDPRARRGLVRLAADLLEDGTRALASAEFVDELDGLGAQFSVAAGEEDLMLRLSVLDECLPRALELFLDVLRAPRFAAADFERRRRARLLELDTRADRIQELAEDALAALVFGREHPRGAPALGERAALEALTLAELGDFWQRHAVPGGARLCVVGGHTEERLRELLAPLVARWPAGAAPPRPADPPLVARAGPELVFVDKPGAAQSELRLAHASVPSTHPDYYPLQALNALLGGQFSSRLNLNLREDKGYTYGVRSTFEGGRTSGQFSVACAVEAKVTAAALREAWNEVEGLRAGVREEEVEFVRSSLSRALGRGLESSAARLAWLENLARHGFPADLIERRLAWLATMTRAELERLVREHLRPSELVLLVVGDRNVAAEGLAELGFGAPAGLELVDASR